MPESAALRAELRRETIPHSAPTIGEQEIAAVNRVMRSGRIAQGREVEAFERDCAEYCERRYAVAVSSGTAALHLALAAVDATHVAIPAYACAAMITAARMHGARVTLSDVGADYNLDPALVPAQCDAVISAHLFGGPASLPRHDCLIEDIAQSIGGPTGNRGVVAIASFYATKLMTTGEGGMALTDDQGLAEFVRDRRDYDNRDTFEARFAYKMTDMQAAMGRVQLRRLPEFIARRRAIAREYNAAFRTLPLTLPHSANHVFSRYVVDCDERDALEQYLNALDIEAKRPVYRPAHHYFSATEKGNRGRTPLTLRSTSIGEVDEVGWIVRRKMYPGADAAHERALSLPIHPSLHDEDVDYVIESVCRFYK